jgi:hypothetical protein
MGYEPLVTADSADCVKIFCEAKFRICRNITRTSHQTVVSAIDDEI